MYRYSGILPTDKLGGKCAMSEDAVFSNATRIDEVRCVATLARPSRDAEHFRNQLWGNGLFLVLPWMVKFTRTNRILTGHLA